MQHAVDPEADGKRVLLRFEVDIAGAVFGRLEDDRVDEAHERRVRDPVVRFEIVTFILDDFELHPLGDR